MTKTYNEWLVTARRWDKAVDFGSPMSAWTQQMLAEKVAEDKAKGE